MSRLREKQENHVLNIHPEVEEEVLKEYSQSPFIETMLKQSTMGRGGKIGIIMLHDKYSAMLAREKGGVTDRYNTAAGSKFQPPTLNL